jgi:hypothetical protein
MRAVWYDRQGPAEEVLSQAECWKSPRHMAVILKII